MKPGATAYSDLKAAWHVDRIATLREGAQIVPVELQLIISDYCNQDCFFCAYRASNGLSHEQFADAAGNSNPKRMIPRAKVEELLQDAAAVGVKSVIFTGGGEPTAHPDHMALFRLALDLKLSCGLNTNGVVLRDGWQDVLPRFAYVRFSVDAGNADEYAQVRRTSAASYAKVLGHIREVSDEVQRQSSPTVVGAGYVVTPDNWPNLLVGVNALTDAGCAYVRLACMQSTVGRDAYGDKWDAAHDAASAVAAANDRVVNLFDDRLGIHPEYTFCGMQQFVLYVGANLKTYRCCYTAYTALGETGDLTHQTLRNWLESEQKRERYATFDARACSTCALDSKNRVIDYLVGPKPLHVEFV